jgi:hypothetical protein
MEAMCANRTDKDLFWGIADEVLTSSADMLEEYGAEKYRWLDVCLVGTIFAHFGEEFSENNRVS